MRMEKTDSQRLLFGLVVNEMDSSIGQQRNIQSCHLFWGQNCRRPLNNYCRISFEAQGQPMVAASPHSARAFAHCSCRVIPGWWVPFLPKCTKRNERNNNTCSSISF